jgi:hypothetical protein
MHTINHNLVTLYEEEGNGFVRLSIDEALDAYIMHVDFKKFSLSDYRRYRKAWKLILERLKQVGITEVYSLTDSKKERKFNLMFGFKSTGNLAVDDKGILSEILKLEVV